MIQRRFVGLGIGCLVIILFVIFTLLPRGATTPSYKRQGNPIVISSGSSAVVQGFNGVGSQQTSTAPTSSLELLQAASGPQSGY